MNIYVRFEVFMELAMKNAACWVATPCGFYKNLRFGGMYRLIMVKRITDLETALAVTSN
jgi:hypothetical protein